MITRMVLGLLVLLGITRPGFSWNLLSQGPLVLTLNAVVLIGLVVFLVFIKAKEKRDE